MSPYRKFCVVGTRKRAVVLVRMVGVWVTDGRRVVFSQGQQGLGAVEVDGGGNEAGSP